MVFLLLFLPCYCTIFHTYGAHRNFIKPTITDRLTWLETAQWVGEKKNNRQLYTILCIHRRYCGTGIELGRKTAAERVRQRQADRTGKRIKSFIASSRFFFFFFHGLSPWLSPSRPSNPWRTPPSSLFPIPLLGCMFVYKLLLLLPAEINCCCQLGPRMTPNFPPTAYAPNIIYKPRFSFLQTIITCSTYST